MRNIDTVDMVIGAAWTLIWLSGIAVYAAIVFGRLAKPLRKMADKLTDESQRIRFELSNMA